MSVHDCMYSIGFLEKGQTYWQFASCGDECLIDTYLKIVLLVASMVSPQLSTHNQIEHIIDKSSIGTIASPQLMGAPKSPLPPQKSMSSELPPLFTHIAYCESRDRQFDEDGDVLRGDINPHDIGRYQINTVHWAEQAKKLGFDLHTEQGNEAMALYLYKKFGTKPWRSSQKCWSKASQVYAATN